jgi:selenocysteine lyase/cysteine desulfurase
MRHVPLHRLADEIGERTARCATQAVGWMPVSAGEFDVTMCGAYKWPCSPHGTALLTASREAAASPRGRSGATPSVSPTRSAT